MGEKEKKLRSIDLNAKFKDLGIDEQWIFWLKRLVSAYRKSRSNEIHMFGIMAEEEEKKVRYQQTVIAYRIYQ